MKINSLLASIRYGNRIAALAAVLAVAIGGCDVTQPDEDPWRNVSAFSWPVDKVLRYRTDDLENGVQTFRDITTKIAAANTEVNWDGTLFYEMRDPAIRFSRYFLPLKDTLLTRNAEFPSDLALVAPLEKGHSWICGTRTVSTDTGEVVVPWRATILERYSYRKIGSDPGKVYRNVIEVEYKPEFAVDADGMQIWTRFYAEGEGLVQTIQSFVSRPVRPDDPPPTPKPIERTVLVKTEEAPGL